MMSSANAEFLCILVNILNDCPIKESCSLRKSGFFPGLWSLFLTPQLVSYICNLGQVMVNNEDRSLLQSDLDHIVNQAYLNGISFKKLWENTHLFSPPFSNE